MKKPGAMCNFVLSIMEPNPYSCKCNTIDDKTIYLGVQTNIVCVDDRSEEIGSCMKKEHLLLYIWGTSY